jgi:hypothetical protein
MYRCNQGRREVGGGPGQILFQGPLCKKKFSGKKIFGQQTPPPVDNFLGQKSRDFISIFHAKFRYLAQKTDILSFARKYLTHKKDWSPTKKFQGPPAPRGNLPRPPLGGPGCNTSQRQISSCEQESFREDFVAATCRTNSKWRQNQNNIIAVCTACEHFCNMPWQQNTN